MPIQAIHPPSKGRMFLALLYNSNISLEQIKGIIRKEFGEIEDSFAPKLNSLVSYYKKEMGENLERQYLLIKGEFDRSDLVKIKKKTMQIEVKHSLDNKRVVNIDPGLILLEQSLLISTKPYSHRVFISDNLYIELNHIFEKGEYRPLSWTYPDYKESETLKTFEYWRKTLTHKN